jgi:hypothetical protein
MFEDSEKTGKVYRSTEQSFQEEQIMVATVGRNETDRKTKAKIGLQQKNVL